jgi:iron complex transport system ATP-binding protein
MSGQFSAGGPGLRCEDLSIGYDRARPLAAGLEIGARHGELVALVGPNGSGKSTLLRVLAGLRRGLSGTVLLDGVEVGALEPAVRARLVAVGLSSHETPAHVRVRDLVSLGRYPYTSWLGGLTDKDRTAVADALAVTGITTLADREVATLSDGEAQKAHIARGIAQEAPLLLLDEPTAYLDVTARFEITHMLRELAHRHGRIVVFSTHDLAIARETADRMWLFAPGAAGGGRVLEGAPEDLVLDGSLGRVFSRRGVHFTAAGDAAGPTGAGTDAAGKPVVELRGTDRPRLEWTRHALSRAGFVCVGGAPHGEEAGSGAAAGTIAVTVTRDGWVIGGEREAGSVLELLSILRETGAQKEKPGP